MLIFDMKYSYQDREDVVEECKMPPIGITFGAWDMLHPGHLFFLNACRQNCSRLIVGLHVDPSLERPEKNKPIETLYERYTRLKFCNSVDEIIPYETEDDLLDILTTQSHDSVSHPGLIRFLGYDYIVTSFTGDEYSSFITPHFIERNHNFSSSSYWKRFQQRIIEKNINSRV